ncbi:MAG: carbohydrate kinase [Granulosicoccus sp.]|nr:carbohydrate kinase [Granulosicoccus sp.]
MNGHVAVIDLGKTNSKVALVDTRAATELEVITTPAATSEDGLYPHLDDRIIEEFVINSLRELARLEDINAVTVTTHGATAALIDSGGQLALPVLDYEFDGPDALADEYEAIRPPYSETGSPRLPNGLNIGAQLFWQASTQPAAFARTDCILTWPQYWIHRLSGIRCNDVSSLGAHTDLYAPHQRRFSTLIERMHWTSLMPPNVPSGQALGTLTAEFCRRTGLEPGTAVHTGIHDSNASLVPHLLSGQTCFSVVSTGTWIICMNIGGENVALSEKRDCLYNVNAYGDPVASSRFMGGRERQLIIDQEVHRFESNPGTQAAAYGALLRTEIDDTAMIMPTAVQKTGPYPDAEFTWLKSARTTDPAQRYCCISLYLALMSAECLSLIGAQGPIHVEGPLAHDAVFTRMLRAVCGRPVLVSTSMTGTSVGAAMLIARPDHMPAGHDVVIDDVEQRWLRDYAQRWQAAVYATR